MSEDSPLPRFAIHGGDYEHVLELPGTYEGIALDYQSRAVSGLFAEMLATRRFEICEFSLANAIILHAAGERWLTPLPIFPYRAFRHAVVFVRSDSDLASFAQLSGRRVGIEDYSMTAAVWLRGLIEDEYGVDHRAVTWVTQQNQRFPLPAGATVEYAERELQSLLVNGDIDALLGLSLASKSLPAGLRPLLPDAEAAERDYYQRTKIYPINHCVAIRSDVLAQQPSLSRAVATAYDHAKAAAYRRKLGSTLMPWGKPLWVKGFEAFGGDPLPYGLTPVNRLVVETLGRYLQRQGFIEAVPDTDELFAA